MTVFGNFGGPYHVPGLLSVLAAIRQNAEKGAVICTELGDREQLGWFSRLAIEAMAREAEARRKA